MIMEVFMLMMVGMEVWRRIIEEDTKCKEKRPYVLFRQTATGSAGQK
jgi:hypothetical protein